jgi:hypothetical protein
MPSKLCAVKARPSKHTHQTLLVIEVRYLQSKGLLVILVTLGFEKALVKRVEATELPKSTKSKVFTCNRIITENVIELDMRIKE